MKGRPRDPVRDHFRVSGKINTCLYCEKEFSSPVTIALKGHLAGGIFARSTKTTSCPNVDENLRLLYIQELNSREKNKRTFSSRTRSNSESEETKTQYQKNSVDESDSLSTFKGNDTNDSDDIKRSIETFFVEKAFDVSREISQEHSDNSSTNTLDALDR